MDLPTLLEKLRPILGDEAVARYAEVMQLADAKTAKVIEVSLRRRLAEATGDPFGDRSILLEPIPANRAQGEFNLGTVCYGKRQLHAFGLGRDELLQHTMIFGRSGAGKTNLSFLLLCEFAQHPTAARRRVHRTVTPPHER